MTHKMLNKKKELSRNKENITQQIYITRRKHDEIKRKRSYFFHVNYFLCNDDRTKKEKNRDIDVAKKQTHERNQTTRTKRNQCSSDNNEANVEKKRNINNFNNLALVESKDARETKKKRHR